MSEVDLGFANDALPVSGSPGGSMRGVKCGCPSFHFAYLHLCCPVMPVGQTPFHFKRDLCKISLNKSVALYAQMLFRAGGRTSVNSAAERVVTTACVHIRELLRWTQQPGSPSTPIHRRPTTDMLPCINCCPVRHAQPAGWGRWRTCPPAPASGTAPPPRVRAPARWRPSRRPPCAPRTRSAPRSSSSTRSQVGSRLSWSSQSACPRKSKIAQAEAAWRQDCHLVHNNAVGELAKICAAFGLPASMPETQLRLSGLPVCAR